MQKKNYEKIVYPIISLACILFCLLFSIHFWSFNEAFYTSEHGKLTLYGKSIADHIGISDEQLKELTSFTLDYLNDPDASLDLRMNIKGEMREVFTDDEKAHMVDVRRLNLTASQLLVICSILTLCGIVYALLKKECGSLFRSYQKTFLCFMAAIAVLGAWILIDFDSFWTMFHHIFFPGNDLWLLDLRSDVLIMIVPPDFFNHLVIRIVVTAVALILFLFLLLHFLMRKEETR